MNLLDIAPVEKWNEFSKEMHEAYGISFGISDTKGARVSTYANWCNRLCPKIKGDPQSLAAICAVAAQYFTDQTRQTRQPEIGVCDIGLIKIAIPIFVGDTFLGTAGGCGLMAETCEVETFLIQKVTAKDEAAIDTLLKEIEPMPLAKAKQMAAEVVRKLDPLISQVRAR